MLRFPDLLCLWAKSFNFTSAWHSHISQGDSICRAATWSHSLCFLNVPQYYVGECKTSPRLLHLRATVWFLLAITERWLHGLIMGCPTAATELWRRHDYSSSKPLLVLLVCSHSAVLVLCFFFYLRGRASGRVRDWEKRQSGGEGVATHSRRWGGGRGQAWWYTEKQ